MREELRFAIGTWHRLAGLANKAEAQGSSEEVFQSKGRCDPSFPAVILSPLGRGKAAGRGAPHERAVQ